MYLIKHAPVYEMNDHYRRFLSRGYSYTCVTNRGKPTYLWEKKGWGKPVKIENTKVHHQFIYFNHLQNGVLVSLSMIFLRIQEITEVSKRITPYNTKTDQI